MENRRKIGKRFLSWLLMAVMVVSLLPVSSMQAEAAGMPGARSESNTAGDVFLGGNYIEVGVSKSGSFGTSVKPTGTSFHTDSAVSGLGLISDGDGWNVGTESVTGDFFLPGSPEERWQFGYIIDGEEKIFIGDDRCGTTTADSSYTVPPTTTDESDIGNGLLKAVTSAETIDGVQFQIVTSFGADDKFFKTEVFVTNNSDKEITDVRFSRSFDPDQDASKNSNYKTYNKVVCQPDTNAKGSEDNMAMVVGCGGTTLSGLFYLAFDNRAVAAVLGGLSPTGTLYTATDLWPSTAGAAHSATVESIELTNAMITAGNTNGYVLADTGIALSFKLGTLSNGSSDELNYYTSLDPKVTESLDAIIKSVASVAVTSTTITVENVDPDFMYSLWKGDSIIGEWIDGSDTTKVKDGMLVFDNLEPDTAYSVKTIAKENYNEEQTNQDEESVESSDTQTALDPLDPEKGDEVGEETTAPELILEWNSITIQNANSTYSYQLQDADGKVVKDWVRPDEMKIVTFSDLSEETTYYLAAKKEDNSNSDKKEITTLTHPPIKIVYYDNLEDEEIAVPAADENVPWKKSYTLSTEQLTKGDEYLFLGWAIDPDAAEEDYAPGETVTLEEDTALYAVWKLPMEVTADKCEVTYDGKPHTIQVNVTVPADGYTVQYGTTKDSFTTEAILYTNAGSYTVYYQVSKEDYQITRGSERVIINKADPVITLTEKVYPQLSESGTTYTVDAATVTGIDGTPISLGDVTYTYYKDKACTQKTGPDDGAVSEGGAPANEGVYYVKASVKAGTNYNAAESAAVKMVVAPKVYYLDASGEQKYCQLEEALNPEINTKKSDVHIIGTTLVDEDITIPEDFVVVIDENVTLTIEEGAALNNDGTIQNNGVIDGEGTLINNYKINGGTVDTANVENNGSIKNVVLSGVVENNGTISNGSFSGPVKNNATGTIDESTFTNSVENEGTINDSTVSDNGEIVNNGDGKVTRNNKIVTYTVTFIKTYGLDVEEADIETQIVAWGSKLEEPVLDEREDALFEGKWYTDEACTDEWDFDKDAINSNVTLYAKWKDYSTFEAYWVDEDGDKHYGTFEDVLKEVQQKVGNGENCEGLHIQKPVDVDEDVMVAEGVPVVIDKDGKLNLADGTTFDVPGGIINNGTIGSIPEYDEEGTKPTINGDVENNGSIEDITIDGDVENKEKGTISDSDINGALDNSGKVSDSKVDGNVTNNEGGILSDTTITDGNNLVNNGDYTEGDTPVMHTVTYQIEPAESAESIDEQSVKHGGSVSFVRPVISTDSDLVFSGWYKDTDYSELWDFATDVVMKDVTLYTKLQPVSSFDAFWKAPKDGELTYGTVEQALQSGSSDVTIQKNAVIPDGTVIPKDMIVTVGEGVTVTIPDEAKVTLDGTLINNGTVNNNGIIGGTGALTNSKTISGGMITVKVENAGTINEADLRDDVINKNGGAIYNSTLRGNVTNDGNISNSTLTESSMVTNNKNISGCDIKGRIVNTEDGKIVDDSLESISYHVIFDMNGYGLTVPESQTVVCGRIVKEPEEVKDEEYVFLAWYKDKACTEGQEWDFATDTVSAETTLYAKWRAKNTYEAYWIGASGGKEYGTLEEAVKASEDGAVELHIQNNVNVAKTIVLPEGTELIIEPGVTMTLEPGISLNVPGGITNNGIITGSEEADKPVIIGKLSNGTDAELMNCEIKGNVDNSGTITDSSIIGDIANKVDASVENSDITGTFENAGEVAGSNVKGNVTNTGNVSNSEIKGDVTNGGAVSETAIQADKVTNEGTITGGSITGADGIGDKANVINEENGKIEQASITGDITNNGTITNSTLIGGVDNNGDISSSTITAKEEGDSVQNNESGKITGTEITGPLDNDGKLIDNDLKNADVDNTDGSMTDANGEPVIVTVSFNVQGKGTAPAEQTVEYDKKAVYPMNPQDTDYTMTGWYRDADCTEEWNFETNTVKENVMLYAKWESKSSFEAYWTGKDEICYGTLEEALKSGSSDVTIQKNVTMPEKAVIPKDMTVTVKKDAAVTIPTGTEVAVNGILNNEGTIYNNGTIIDAGTINNQGILNNNGTVAGDGILNNDKTIYGGTIEADVNNTGKIDGASLNGEVENDGRISDSTLAGIVTNNGTISDSTLSGNITNDGTISGGELTESSKVTNNKNISGCDIKGKVVNTENGRIVDDSLEGISYQITFDTNGYGSMVPERQTVACGRTVKEPEEVKDTDYVFLAWYKDKACTEGQEWDFATDTVSAETTLYAKWRAKNTYEACWINADGKKEYGSFEEALESGSQEVHVQKNITVDKVVVISEDTQVTVDPDVTLTLADTGKIDTAGTITNKGTITGDQQTETPQITGNVKNENGAVIKDCGVEGNVNNTGTITDVSISGALDNTGTVENTIIEGEVTNDGMLAASQVIGDVINNADGRIDESTVKGNVENAGSVSGSSISGDVTNRGTISETTIQSNKVDNSGAITGGSIKALDGTEEPAVITNGSDGVISGTEITGDVTNDGEITDGSKVSGEITNNGVISGSTLDGTVINKGTLENNTLDQADVDNTEGVVKENEQAVTYTVNFVSGDYGINPEPQIIDYGKIAVCPKDPVDEEYAFAGWYMDSSFSAIFDFESIPIKMDTTVYGKWILKSNTEAYWTVNEETKYGTLAQALESGSKDIHITKDMEFSQDITIPEEVKVTVESGVVISVNKNTAITVSKDAEFVNNGKLNNDGIIAGDGKVTNNKNIAGGTVDTEIVNNGTVNSTELNGYVTNNKAINDCEINAGLNNSNGTVSVDGDEVIFKDRQVKGTIYKETSEMPEAQSNATVKLVQGNEVIKTVVTDADGKYDLSEIPSGVYNLIIESAGTVNTLLAEVGEDDIQITDIELSEGNLNNTVEVKEGTPNIVVGGLNAMLTAENTVEGDTAGITDADREIVKNGGSVEVRFVAEQIKEIPSDESDIEKVVDEDKKQVGMNLDLTVLKAVTEVLGEESSSVETKLTELQAPIMINIPIAKDMQGKENYVVYRFHDGMVDRITENSDEEYIKVQSGGTAVTLYAKKFSTYVLAYDKENVSDTGVDKDKEQQPSIDVTADSKEDSLTADLSTEQKKNVAAFISSLGLSEKEAVELLQFAEKNDIAMDTLLVTENTILTQKNDSDIKGSSFTKTQAKSDVIKNTSIKLKWSKVTGADGYLVYGNQCGKNNKYKLITTIKSGKTTSYTQKKLKKGTYYKYVIRAYKLVGNKKITIALSKTIHATTSGGKYGVAKSVKTNKSSISLKKGKSFTIKASEVKQNKTIKRHRDIAYESSNTAIATVSKEGTVKGVKKGTCYVYVYAQNGVYKKIKVTVQ